MFSAEPFFRVKNKFDRTFFWPKRFWAQCVFGRQPFSAGDLSTEICFGRKRFLAEILFSQNH